MGICGDLAMYYEFQDPPSGYPSSQDIYSEYGILIKNSDDVRMACMTLFFIFVICRGIAYAAVKFLFTGRAFEEDLHD